MLGKRFGWGRFGGGVLAVALGFLLTLGASGCSSVSTMTDFDEAYDFSTLGTFAVSPQSRAGMEKPTRDAPLTLVDKRLRSAVEAELEAKGYRRAEPGSADFIVHYFTGTRDRVDVTVYPYAARRRPWMGAPATAHHWTEGTLVLDLVDRRANELVWRGVARGAIQDMNPREGDLAKVVEKMLEEFPPER